MSSTTPTIDVRTVPVQDDSSIAKLKAAHGDGQCCGLCGGT
ncbi:hypothetical protein [Aquabacterium sp.]|nr:hypothetical protein [Aquabacterium sp.]MDI1260691.1 hypothetical protein [Aquabacterium sp.]